jgi:hypothetical protein
MGGQQFFRAHDEPKRHARLVVDVVRCAPQRVPSEPGHGKLRALAWFRRC